MASFSFFASILLIFLSVSWIFNACNASSQGGVGFSMNLIHKDSPRSPHYQPSLTSKDRVRAMIDRSFSRVRYLSSIFSARGGGGDVAGISNSPASAPAPAPASASASAPASDSNVYSKVIAGDGDYIMELEIGTPPVKIMASADTGSDLIWIQCQPCEDCYNQTDPIFDPRKSSTFNGSVSCNDDICQALPYKTCSSQNTCQYEYEYGDLSVTSGTLSKDTFTFSSDSNKKLQVQGNSSSSSIPGIAFGCSYNSKGTFEANEDGLIGLGGGHASLVRQLDSSINGKFSYCLVPYKENASSTLNLGDNAVVNGPGVVTVPMINGLYDTFYTLQFTSVDLGKHNIPVPRGLSTQMIVDSGTTLTFIPLELLVLVMDDLSKIVNLNETNDPEGSLQLCYSYSSKAPAYPFPDITFNFGNSSRLVLSAMQTFIFIADDIVCLAMAETMGGMGFSVFGNIAQQNLHVGYDLHNKSISFAPANCSTFKI
ncbi:Aspartic peptidase A1 family protein [Dioscorea alata]|uniref:Aspartic peptidase A1 family protein n=1 Tax=Dioscorea alata TaxID=55571 RepID=A0ACB7UFA7_DIOAL|nr:Aspartic peptidase A1 family protein [Dioscorea alata]